MPTTLSRAKLDQAMRAWQVKHQENLTYTELARRAGIAYLTFQRIKSGNVTRLDLDKLHAIGKVLECDPRTLLETTWTGHVSKSDSQKKVHALEEKSEYEKLIQREDAKRISKIVSAYKDWIVREQYADRPDILLLRPGASSSDPSPDDLRLLEGPYAEEWRNQNPPEVANKR